MCTEFTLPGSTKKRISGRSMDFKATLPWIISGIPAGTKIRAFQHLETGIPLSDAYSWTTIYDCVGIGADEVVPLVENGRNSLVDGLNAEGLSGAALWLPNSVYPQSAAAPKGAKFVSCLDIVAWAVSTHKTVDSLKADLEAVRDGKPTLSGDVLAFWDPFQFHLPFSDGVKNFSPLHYQFHDTEGKSLVMEFRNGQIELTDNSDLGVMTNYPFLDWHRTNLENYLSVTNADTNTGAVVTMPLNAFGHGNGTMALSASPTPPARFIRTAHLISFGMPWLNTATNEQALAFAANVLGNVTVLRLMSIDAPGDQKGDFTQWTVVRDHDNKALYLRTADGVGTWKIDFRDFIKSAPCYVKISDDNNCTMLKP
jgi:choloylglycine hydrolase